MLFVGANFLPHLAEMEGALTSVRTIVVFGAPAPDRDNESWLGGHPARDPLAAVAPHDVAMQLYPWVELHMVGRARVRTTRRGGWASCGPGRRRT